MIDHLTPSDIAAASWHGDLSGGDPQRRLWGVDTGAAAEEILSRSRHVVQIHGRTVLAADEISGKTEADGIFTTIPDTVVAVKTADCLPLLFSAKAGKPLAMAIHAGWRGFCAGIIQEGVRQATSAGAKMSSMRVTIGPAICAHHFEIGPEVVAALVAHSGENAAMNYLSKGKGDRWHADLQTAAVIDLIGLGFNPADIEVIRLCTFEAKLPSYRRDGKGCGRLVSWVRCVDPVADKSARSPAT